MRSPSMPMRDAHEYNIFSLTSDESEYSWNARLNSPGGCADQGSQRGFGAHGQGRLLALPASLCHFVHRVLVILSGSRGAHDINCCINGDGVCVTYRSSAGHIAASNGHSESRTLRMSEKENGSQNLISSHCGHTASMHSRLEVHRTPGPHPPWGCSNPCP